MIAAVGELPADAAQISDAALASRMRELVRLRAMVDAALVEQVAAFDARAGARYDGQTSTHAWLRSQLRLGGQAGAGGPTAGRLAGAGQGVRNRGNHT